NRALTQHERRWTRPKAGSTVVRPFGARSRALWFLERRDTGSPTTNLLTYTRPGRRIRPGPGNGGNRGSVRVDLLDLLVPFLAHHVTLDLEGSSHLAAFLGEVAGQDRELPDPLGPGHSLVGLVHGLLDRRVEVGIVGHLGDLTGLAGLLLPLFEGLGVDGDQSRDELAVVADHHALADQGVGADAVLKDGRGDVLAGRGHDDFLLAAGDGEEAVLVQGAEVTGVVVTVLGEGLLGGLLVVPVADHDVVALEEDLTVVGDPDAGARQRSTDGADLVEAGAVDRGRRGRFGQTVTFDDGEADATEEVAEAR